MVAAGAVETLAAGVVASGSSAHVQLLRCFRSPRLTAFLRSLNVRAVLKVRACLATMLRVDFIKRTLQGSVL